MINDELELKRMKNKAEKLANWLSQLDTICDLLYNSLEYDGVWEVIDKLEDVRVRYYIEHYDCRKMIRIKEKS